MCFISFFIRSSSTLSRSQIMIGRNLGGEFQVCTVATSQSPSSEQSGAATTATDKKRINIIVQVYKIVIKWYTYSQFIGLEHFGTEREVFAKSFAGHGGWQQAKARKQAAEQQFKAREGGLSLSHQGMCKAQGFLSVGLRNYPALTVAMICFAAIVMIYDQGRKFWHHWPKTLGIVWRKSWWEWKVKFKTGQLTREKWRRKRKKMFRGRLIQSRLWWRQRVGSLIVSTNWEGTDGLSRGLTEGVCKA